MPPGPEALSEYELERERNIAANKRHLASLGLNGPFFPPTKRAAVRRQRPSADPDWLPVLDLYRYETGIWRYFD